MFKRILLGTDFTATSSPAEDVALELAKRYGAKLIVLHVIEQVPFDDDDPTISGFYESLAAATRGKMGAISARCGVEDVPCEAHVEVGRRWEMLLMVAHQTNADLLVLGVRGGDPRARALATTAHKIFIASDRPVLFVPDNVADR